MEENEHIFSDEDLLYLAEYCPMAIGGTLDEFLAEAQRVAGAIDKAGVNLPGLCAQARALFFMWGFYFLGVLRGGEAYRAQLLDDLPGADEPPTMAFELPESCASDMEWQLQGTPTETLRAIYRVVGLTANRTERRSGPH